MKIVNFKLCIYHRTATSVMLTACCYLVQWWGAGCWNRMLTTGSQSHWSSSKTYWGASWPLEGDPQEGHLCCCWLSER